MKTQKTIAYLAILAALTIGVIASFNSQYVQIPVPTDVTPPLGHGHERLRVPSDNDSFKRQSLKQQQLTEPVQVTYLGSLGFRHLDNTVVKELESGIDLYDGEVVVNANADKNNQFKTGLISSQLDSITVSNGSIAQAIVDKTNNTITIRSLHGETSLQLTVISIDGYNQHKITLRDGQEFTLRMRSSYRSPFLTTEQLDKLVVSSDFVSVVKASPILQRMRTSYNKNDRRIYQTAEKTAAALKQLH